jgi:hypothetical protein
MVSFLGATEPASVMEKQEEGTAVKVKSTQANFDMDINNL